MDNRVGPVDRVLSSQIGLNHHQSSIEWPKKKKYTAVFAANAKD